MRLFNEASISLPSVSYLEPEDDTRYDQIMAGMQQQRIRLKRDQQIPEWEV